ncbi:MAG TPA: hypothetical protein VFO86_14730 [Terriglobia bacterium]|nr:hypothetical protein [Terriglobia bacterium]
MNRRCVLFVLGLACLIQSDATVHAQSSEPFHAVRRFTGKFQESIQAFDISPDGNLLALLFESESAKNGWVRIEIQSLAREMVLKDLKFAVDLRPDEQHFPWYVPHLEFSADQRFLVIQDSHSIRVLSLANYQVERTFTSPRKELSLPSSIAGAASGDRFLVSYGRNVPNRSALDTLRSPLNYNELIDISDGSRFPGWESQDIPESISPDGKLALVSDWSENKNLVEIGIVETLTGKPLVKLHSGFAYKKPWDADPVGIVVGRFLSNSEVLLSPDGHFDKSGHKAGKGFKVIRISDGRVLREMRPDYFGPTGDLGTSSNRNTFFSPNVYSSPADARVHDVFDKMPELLIYKDLLSKPKTYRLAFPNTEGPFLTARVSNDASVVAVGLEEGITIFQRK